MNITAWVPSYFLEFLEAPKITLGGIMFWPDEFHSSSKNKDTLCELISSYAFQCFVADIL